MKNTILNNQYSYGSDTPVYEKGGWTNDNGDYSDLGDGQLRRRGLLRPHDAELRRLAGLGGQHRVPRAHAARRRQVDPLWGGSFLLIEYDMYQQYDNLAMIRRDYSHMAAYVDDLAGQIAPCG